MPRQGRRVVHTRNYRVVSVPRHDFFTKIIGCFHDLRHRNQDEEKPNTKFTEDMYSLI